MNRRLNRHLGLHYCLSLHPLTVAATCSLRLGRSSTCLPPALTHFYFATALNYPPPGTACNICCHSSTSLGPFTQLLELRPPSSARGTGAAVQESWCIAHALAHALPPCNTQLATPCACGLHVIHLMQCSCSHRYSSAPEKSVDVGDSRL